MIYKWGLDGLTGESHAGKERGRKGERSLGAGARSIWSAENGLKEGGKSLEKHMEAVRCAGSGGRDGWRLCC